MSDWTRLLGFWLRILHHLRCDGDSLLPLCRLLIHGVMGLFLFVNTYFLFCFSYSELSSFADRPDVSECIQILCQGEYFLHNEDCTKVGCRGKSRLRSFVEACYGESLLCRNPIFSGEANANFGI
jgi:hypothetical protein